ncbi:MAG: phenylacetic acid degradation protein paaN [Bacteroidetes bacterium]|nr:MAG: phenylacetic acid degradation protein paaN [Bacteroidota bacterium]
MKLIDYTGGSAFGKYIEALPGKISFTEKAGVNSVILDSVVNLDAVLQNLAFSVCLYSKQMCTSPQNFFIPANGVKEGDTLVPFDEVAARFKKQIEDLVANPKTGAGTLAALQNVNTLNRVRNAKNLGKVLLEAKIVAQPGFEKAMTCSPVMLEVESKDKVVFEGELFGPIIVLVKTKDTTESVSLAKEMAAKHGAITCAAYTTDAATEEHIYREMEDVFVPVSVNLTGFIWVNQHAAFSDLHVSGGNPAGNACFVNPDFVNRRFVWVGHRKVI